MKTQGDLNFDQNRSNMGNASSHSVECIPSKKGNTHFSLGKIKCGTRSTEITCPTCGKRWKRCGPCLTPRLSVCGGKIPPKMKNYFGGFRRMLGMNLWDIWGEIFWYLESADKQQNLIW